MKSLTDNFGYALKNIRETMGYTGVYQAATIIMAIDGRKEIRCFIRLKMLNLCPNIIFL